MGNTGHVCDASTLKAHVRVILGRYHVYGYRGGSCIITLPEETEKAAMEAARRMNARGIDVRVYEQIPLASGDVYERLVQ